MTVFTVNIYSVAVLVILQALASWSDVRERRVPNALVSYGLILAFGIASTAGSTGLTHAFAGMALGGLLLLPFYALGGMGAGDVKLMAMTGAYLGPTLAVSAVAGTFMAGVILGVVMLFGGRVVQSAAGYKLMNAVWPHYRDHAQHLHRTPQGPGLPYAVAILIGTVVALAVHPEFL